MLPIRISTSHPSNNDHSEGSAIEIRVIREYIWNIRCIRGVGNSFIFQDQVYLILIIINSFGI